MKIFISADIEGVTGVTDWSECEPGGFGYEEARHQMTREVAAACDAAREAGATEIVIKDAHDSAMNLIHKDLPPCVRLVRGWARDPYSMMQGLDRSFDGVMMTGYHSMAGSDTSPLAHTFNRRIAELRINDMPMSEFHMNALVCGHAGVPVLFLSGDEGICKDAIEMIPQMETASVKKGIGNSTTSIHPDLALEKIRTGVQNVFRKGKREFRNMVPELPEYFTLELSFKEFKDAYAASFYPNVTQTGPRTVTYETDDLYDLLRALMFIK